MKAFLMYRDRDFDVEAASPPGMEDLASDLELPVLYAAMASGDKFLAEIIPPAVLTGFSGDLDTIAYRQGVLRDCMENPAVVREIYAIVVDAIDSERKNYFGAMRNYPSGTLSHAVSVLKMFVEKLRELRKIADVHSGGFRSEGFTRFFQMLQGELDDAYFAEIKSHLKTLEFRHGVLVSASLGPGNRGADHALHKEPDDVHGWLHLERFFTRQPPSYTYRLAPRDEAGARALSELRNRGVNLVANALAQSTDHILDFFRMLRRELAFYIGCLNLHERLVEKGLPVCFPEAASSTTRLHSFRELYDVCLALAKAEKPIGNNADMGGKNLVIVTGANQGGKSTFLRSIGLAQLMMQCGMFVGAESFAANVVSGVFTHYKREEDTTMESGKFDEELRRMSAIADHIDPNALLLLNESFSATNEREGSEVGRQIVDALLDGGMKVLFVTHFHEFAHSFERENADGVLFMRAERTADGQRTFRIIEGKPLGTSHGQDIYREVFGEAVEHLIAAK